MTANSLKTVCHKYLGTSDGKLESDLRLKLFSLGCAAVAVKKILHNKLENVGEWQQLSADQ